MKLRRIYLTGPYQSTRRTRLGRKLQEHFRLQALAKAATFLDKMGFAVRISPSIGARPNIGYTPYLASGCDELWILTLRGWETSEAIRIEANYKQWEQIVFVTRCRKGYNFLTHSQYGNICCSTGGKHVK